VAGASGLSGGALKGEDLPADRLGEVHERELRSTEKVVFSAFIDDSEELVLGRARVRDDLVDLAGNQRGFVPVVLQADRESFRWNPLRERLGSFRGRSQECADSSSFSPVPERVPPFLPLLRWVLD
jgi:hypothetical protein